MRHPFEGMSGKEILKEIESRLNTLVFIRNEENEHVNVPPGTWFISLVDITTGGWASDIEECWLNNNSLDFYYLANNCRSSDSITIYPALAELNISLWDDWIIFYKEIMDKEKRAAAFRHQFRKEAYRYSQILKSPTAIYAGDKYCAEFLFPDDDSHVSLEAMTDAIILSDYNFYAIFEERYLSKQKELQYPEQIFLLDDFSDFKRSGYLS